jgi:DNA-damage-inducible protein J
MSYLSSQLGHVDFGCGDDAGGSACSVGGLTRIQLAPQCSYKQEEIMTSNPVVRARIDEQIKDEASAVLAAMGLTVSDALRMMLTRVAREQALPFEPLVPNAKTIKAMRDARRGKTTKHKTLNSLMANLHADD